MNKILCITLLIFSIPMYANAQSCGGGYMQEGGSGVISCVPLYNQNDQGHQAAGPLWATRWGAIATDNKLGHFGGIEHATSESHAKKLAIAECKKFGGKDCKIRITYFNQCGALAWGEIGLLRHVVQNINRQSMML